MVSRPHRTLEAEAAIPESGGAAGAPGGPVEMVQVLAEDPGLGRYLSEQAWARARPVAMAPLLRLRPGRQTFILGETRIRGHLGFLVLNGQITRHVSIGDIGAAELIGPGELLRPWTPPANTGEIVRVSWEALTPIRLAVLDGDFARRIAPWPELIGALLDRAVHRAHAQVWLSAARQARRVEDRVLLALWHFAGRWGEVSPQGRTIRLTKVTGETLARVVGARRQSVSTALGRLIDRGALEREPDGTVTIREPPAAIRHVRR